MAKRQTNAARVREEQARTRAVRAGATFGLNDNYNSAKQEAYSYQRAYERALEEELARRRAEAQRQAEQRSNYLAVKEADEGMRRDSAPEGDYYLRQKRAEDYANTSPMRQYEMAKQQEQEKRRAELEDFYKNQSNRRKELPTTLADVRRTNRELSGLLDGPTLQKPKPQETAAWRQDRDNLIDRFSSGMDAVADVSRRSNIPGYRATPEDQQTLKNWQDTLLEVERRGGIENLTRMQENDAANDRRYGAALRGVNPDEMSFFEKAGNVLGGVFAGAGKQSGVSAMGTYQGLQNTNIMRSEEEISGALNKLVQNYYGQLSNDPSGRDSVTKSMRQGIIDTAMTLGDAEYASRLISYIDDVVRRTQAAHPNGADFSDYYVGTDLASVSRRPDAAWNRLNEIAGSQDVYKAMFGLQDSAQRDIQRAKDVMQSDFGDLLVDAGVSSVQSAADALISAGMGLGGTPFAMLPFAARAFGGNVAEASRAIAGRGQQIGKEMAQKINLSAGVGSAIEVGTEMLWGTVGAMSGVQGGGALDDVTTKRLTDALGRMAKTEKGAKVLSFLGEKIMGGVFEGTEEVIADAANWLFNTAGIYSGEGREDIKTAFQNALTSFATGAMSGLMGEVSKVATGPMQDVQVGRAVRNDVTGLNDMAEAALASDGQLGRTFENIALKRGLDFDSGQSMAEQANRLSNRELGKIYRSYEDTLNNEGVSDIYRAVDRVKEGKELSERDVNRIVRNEEALQYLEDVTGEEISREDVTGSTIKALEGLASRQEESKTARAEYETQREKNLQDVLWERQTTIQTQEALERMGVKGEAAQIITDAFIPGQNALEYAGDAMRFYNQGKNGKELDASTIGTLARNITPGQAMAAYNAGRMERIGEEYNGSEYEEESGSVRVRGGVQRDDGQSAGKPAGGVAGQTRSFEAREEIAGFRGGKKVAGVRSGPISTKELGLRGGTGEKNIQIIQESKSKDFQEAKKIVEERGLKFVGFVGGALEIEHISGRGNKLITQARGYYDPESNTVYVRMDHRVFTGAQLAKHEAMHDKIQKGEVDLAKARDLMRESIGTDKFTQALDAYAALYEGTDLSHDAVFEEMICDAAGNMNEFMFRGHMEDALKNVSAMNAAREAGKKAVGDGQARGSEGKTSIEFDPSTHTEEETRIYQEYLSAVDPGLQQFAGKYYGGATGFERHKISKVSQREARQLNELTGIDYGAYSNNINSDGIRHIDQRHGHGENRADSTMEHVEDVARIGYVIENADDCEYVKDNKGKIVVTHAFSGSDNKGAPLVRFTKKIDGVYAAVLAVSENKYKKLWVVTAFIAKDKSAITQASNADLSALNLTADTAPLSLALSGDTVPNQQEEVKQNLEGKASRDINPEREKLAKETFGTTRDFREAGYIMRDGSMLDFSGKKQGGPSGVRYMDHREVAEVFSEGEISDEDTRYGSNTAYMNAFIDEGNIRLMDHQGVTVGEMEPTKEQYSLLKLYASRLLRNDDYFYLDISDADGNTIESREYFHSDGADRIIRDLKEWYKNGELPYKSELSQFRFSRDMDAAYDKAVKAGDMNAAQRMVNEAAKAAGYDMHLYHGARKGGGFTVFKGWQYFTESKAYAERYQQQDNPDSLYEVYAKSERMFDTRNEDAREIFEEMRQEYGLSAVQESGLPDWTDGYDISEFIEENDLDYDGIILDEGGDMVDGKPVSRGPSYVIRESNQIKSAAPVTYDDNGNVIPLSERFNPENPDIRFSRDIDSEGNTLSEGQAKYFANSKVRDKNGALKAVYHGTESQRFTVFQNGPLVNGRIYGEGYYFADKEHLAQKWGPNVYKVYLNITTPYIRNANETAHPDIVKMVKDKLARNYDELSKDNGWWGNKYSKEEWIDQNKRDYANADVALHNAISDVDGSLPMDRYYAEVAKRETEVLKSLGYDGVIAGTGKDTEYVAFDSNQIKLTDNRNPSGNNDIRFSQDLGSSDLYESERQLRKDLTEALRRQRTLTEQRDKWRRETTLTKGRQVRMDDAKKLARTMAKEHSSKVNTEEVAEKMKALAEYCLNAKEFDEAFYDEARTKSYEIAHMILDEAEILNQNGEEDFYKDMRDYLRSTKMYVPVSVRSDLTPDNWNDYRKGLFGTLNLTGSDTSAMGIDSAYKELQEKFGEWLFPEDITNPADQIRQMLEVVETYRPVYEHINSYDMAEAVEWTASDILGRVVGEELRQTDPTRADKLLAKMDAKLKAQKALARESERKYKRVKAINDHYKEQAAKRKDQKEVRELRARLLKLGRRVNSMKVPQVAGILREQIIGELDLVATRITKRKVANLSALSDWYNEQKRDDPNFFQDKQIEKDLERLGKKQIKDLSREEISDLIRVLQNFENEWSLKKDGKFIGSSVETDRYVSALYTTSDILSTKGRKAKSETARWLSNFFIDNQLSSDRAMKRLTGYRDNDPLRVLMKEVEKGHTNKIDYVIKANKMFAEWLDDDDFAKQISGKKARAIKVTGTPGAGKMTKQVEISPGMAIGFYLSSMNDDNMRHIAQGGIRIPDMSIYRKGNVKLAYEKGELLKFTKEAIREVEKQLTDKEKAFANKVYEYYNKVAPGAINAVSEQLVGFPKAMVKNYYPIKVLQSFLRVDFGHILDGGTPQSLGFLNERVDSAKNPVVLADVVDVLRQSIDQNGTYVGLAIPIRNFELLYSTNAKDDDGKLVSVKESLESQWGHYATDYIDKVIMDVQGKRQKAKEIEKPLNKARGNQAQSALFINAGTGIKQAASGPTAAATLGAKAVIKAFLNPVSLSRKVNPDLISRYTPLYEYRALGYSTPELGDITNKKMDLPKSLKWIEAIDLWTVRRIWRAAEYYVLDNNKDIKPYTHEFYEAVKEKWEQTVHETQPNYTPMQRSQSLRSEGIERSFHLFKTQPYQNFNIIYDAVGEFRAKHQQMLENTSEDTIARYKESKVNLARAIGSQIVSSFVFALMQFVVDMARGKRKKYKDDDDEMTLLSWLKGMGLNILSNGAGMLPLGGLMLEGIESGTDMVLKALGKDAFFEQRYWGVSEPLIDAVNESGNFVGNLLSKVAAFGSGKVGTETFIRNMTDSFGELAALAGIPVSNAIRTMQSLARVTMEGGAATGLLFDGNKLEAEFYSLRMTTDPAKYPGDYYNLLYKAYKKNPVAYKQILQQMLQDGSGVFTEEKIKNQMEKRFKEAQGVGSVKDLEQRWMSPTSQDTYDKGLSKVSESKIWAKASDEQQQKVMDTLYNIAVGNSAGAKVSEKIIGGMSVGLDQTEYLLYTLALQMADSDGNGSYKQAETEAAIRMITGLTDAERAYLFQTQHPTAKKNPWASSGVTRGGRMEAETGGPIQEGPASPQWYTGRRKEKSIQGQAEDVSKRGEGLRNGMGISQQGAVAPKRWLYDNATPGAAFYKDIYEQGKKNSNLYDVMDSLATIASNRAAQLHGEKVKDNYSDNAFSPATPAERLAIGIEAKMKVEKDPKKLKVLQSLSNVLWSEIENGEALKDGTFWNQMLEYLGF